MRGWILYTESANGLKPETYEIDRFITIAQEQNIELEVFRPEQFELIVTQDDRQSLS